MTGIWLSEADVADLLDLDAAIDALTAAFRAEGDGRARSMDKTHTAWPGGTLHAIGAVLTPDGGPDGGVAATKTWAHTPGGAAPLLVLFDADHGDVLAVVEAFALGQLRTAGVSAVATDRLARPDADVLGLCGTGKQALAQAAAVAAVRHLSQIRVWSPTAAHRQALAERVEEALGVPCRPCATASEAVAGAGVITLATRAREPFLSSGQVEPGAHINAIGAITPERAEFEPDLLDRASVVTADSPASARRLSAELRAWCGDDDNRWQRVLPLAQLVSDPDLGRDQGRDGITVLKAMGTGVSDLALGLACWQRATDTGRGRPLPDRVPVAPNLGRRATMQA